MNTRTKGIAEEIRVSLDDPQSDYFEGVLDRRILNNSHSWLRSLLEENSRLSENIKAISEESLSTVRELTNKAQQLREELEQVKKERDRWMDSFSVLDRELRSELAAKDKVLESIKNSPAYTSRTWMREQAGSILSQYAINESKPDTATTSLG